MELDLLKQQINTNKKLYDGRSEHIETIEIIVPDYLPDAKSIITSQAQINIKDKSAADNIITVNGEIHLCFDENKPTASKSVFQMLAAWAEQAEKYRNGEITKEQYDEWRYTYPKLDTTQTWAKVPSQELSDAMVEAFKDKLNNM